MKKNIMNSIKCFLFCLIVLGGIIYLSQFYANRSNAEYNYQAFSEIKENPDVLVFGSSYSEVAFDPNELYGKTGITAYNLSASGQKLDTTYYVLQTVLEYKHPKVVILVMDDIDIIKGSSTLDGEILAIRDIKGLEIDKVKYLYNHFGSRFVEYVKFYLPIIQFHDKLLTGDIRLFEAEENKKLRKLYQKGFRNLESSIPITIAAAAEQKEISTDSIKLVRDMIDLCEDKGIKVMLITVPHIDWYPYADSIRKNFSDCEYLDFYELADEIGLDGQKDFFNEYHVNVQGATKITDYIGEYLQDNYNLVDHRELQENNIWDITYPLYEKSRYREYSDETWQRVLVEAGYSLDNK